MGNVLVVDDEQVVRNTLADILRYEGFQVTEVENGQAALAILQVKAFDVMVLDLKMPGMDGMEVLRNIVDLLPEMAVIVLTAHGTMNSAIESIRYRVFDYLLKPANPKDVVARIHAALAQKQQPKNSIQEERPGERLQVEHLPGGALLYWDKRQIRWESGNLSLTPTETRLLKNLFERQNEMVSHAELVYLIQGYRIETEEAAKILRPVVSRLRQKLTVVPGWDDRIKNVRGAGYVLEIN